MAATPVAADPPAVRTSHSTFAALAAPNYRRYWIGLNFYVLGQRTEYTVFTWLAWELTHDPVMVGLVGMAQGIPLVMFQLVAGVVADRVDRLRLVRFTQLAILASLVLSLVMTLSGLIQIEILFALAALCSIFRAFDEPSRISLLPRLIDRQRLVNAVALGSIPWQAGRVIGPSLSGALIAWRGAASGFALAVFGTLVSLILFTRIRLGPEGDRGDGASPARQLAEGIRFVLHNRLFASLVGLALFNALFGMSYVALLPVFADVYFGTGSTGYGLLQGSHGIGSVVGTFAIAHLGLRLRRKGLVMLLGGGLFGLLLVVFALSTSVALAYGALFLAGFSNTFYLTLASTTIQQSVPDELRGRVMSIFTLCFNIIPLGGALAGALAGLVDARFAISFGGAMIVALSALLILTNPRLRQLT